MYNSQVSPVFTLQFVFTTIHRSEAEEELLCNTVNTNWRIKMRKNAQYSLVPRPLPDFISQPWRKIRRRPGIKTTPRTRNGGLS